ncbi:hypothetical protein Ct9H90mP29_22470 [bacterium]|nr:MAG: hypothetical protein Ct9H90mP29_22470 [bacterium]
MANLMDVSLEIIRKDIFDLLPEYHDSFDYVLEQTCFCAIHPSRRRSMRIFVKGILKMGGHLVGFWFPLDKDSAEEGPPYGTSNEEVKSTFDSGWEIKKEEFSEHSIKPRKGERKTSSF